MPTIVSAWSLLQAAIRSRLARAATSNAGVRRRPHQPRSDSQMRMKLLMLIAAALLLSPLPALAQLGQTATLTGTVTDATGAILPGATVTVASEALIGGSRSSTTDANGVYRFPALPPGAYTVTAELTNFKKSS